MVTRMQMTNPDDNIWSRFGNACLSTGGEGDDGRTTCEADMNLAGFQSRARHKVLSKSVKTHRQMGIQSNSISL